MLPVHFYTIPFVEGGRDEKGADCWGLIVLLYKYFFDVELEKFTGVAATDKDFNLAVDRINKEIEEHKNFYEVTEPQFGDIILLRVHGRPIHVGFCLDKSTMVHTGKGYGVVTEKFTEMRWNNRVLGFYRKK